MMLRCTEVRKRQALERPIEDVGHAHACLQPCMDDRMVERHTLMRPLSTRLCKMLDRSELGASKCMEARPMSSGKVPSCMEGLWRRTQ